MNVFRGFWVCCVLFALLAACGDDGQTHGTPDASGPDASSNPPVSWVKEFPAPGSDPIYAGSADVALDGTIAVAGVHSGVDFGDGPLVADGQYDAFIAVFDAAGTTKWSRNLRLPDGWSPERIAIGPNGHVAVIGSCFDDSPINLGGSDITGSLGALYFGSFDPAGNHVASGLVEGISAFGGTGLAVDDSGRIALAVTTGDPVTIDGTDIVPTGVELILLVTDSTGNLDWYHHYGSPSVIAAECAFDPDGNLVVAMSPLGPIDLGGGPLPGGVDGSLVIAAFDSNGAHLWSRTLAQGNSNTQNIQSSEILVGADGTVSLAGWFSTTGPEFPPPTMNLGADGILTGVYGQDLWLIGLDSSRNIRAASALGRIGHRDLKGAALFGDGVAVATEDFINPGDSDQLETLLLGTDAAGVATWTINLADAVSIAGLGSSADGGLYVVGTTNAATTIGDKTLGTEGAPPGMFLIRLDPL